MLKTLILALLLIGMEVGDARPDRNINSPVVASGYALWRDDRHNQYPFLRDLRVMAWEEEALTQAQEIEEVDNGQSRPELGVTPEDLVRESIWRWFREEEIDTALCIVEAESGFNPLAISRWGDYGLFQLNRIHAVSYDWDRILEIDYNIAAAHDLWTTNGWRPWSTRHLCGV